jgi:hypothetical protein
VPRCDHRGCGFNIRMSVKNRGRGYWKCNVSVLQDRHLRDDLLALIDRTLNHPPDSYLSWGIWEDFKIKAKDLIIAHSTRLSVNRQTRTAQLLKRLNFLYEIEAQKAGAAQNEIINTNGELQAIAEEVKEGNRVRAKIKNLEKPESSAEFYSRSEKISAENKYIEAISIEGTLYTDTQKIIDHCVQFYSDLYNKREVNKSIWPSITDNLTKLTEQESQICEGPFTYGECWQAISQMENGKSPGVDGLPVEFYREYFPRIGQLFIKLANTQPIQTLSPSQRMGIITLIPKKDSDRTMLNNWRPLSLLNTDYKILSKVLVNRLKTLAHRIISSNQNSAIPGRSIFDTLHLLRNVFDYCKQRKFPCIAVSLDQAKAFDKVSHEYLFHIMDQMGIGPDFIAKVNLLYTDIYSQIVVNGFLTATFKITRSLRQGCGLSPLLFNIAIEPFIRGITQSLLFRGVPIPGRAEEERLACFADDVTILAKNEFSVGVALSIFENYSRASGAEINVNKTTALIIEGPFRQSLLPQGVKITKNAKICGVHFGEGATDLNEEMILKSIEKSISSFNRLAFTYFGRAQVTNIFLLSKLWHIATITTLSTTFSKKFESLVFKYIWQTMEKLQRTVVYNIYTAGGLGVFHIPSRISALMIKHLANYLTNRDKRWVPFADFWIAIPLRDSLPTGASGGGVRSERGPNLYYKEALTHLEKFKDRGGTILNSPNMVRIAYRNLLATIVTPPKALSYAPTDRIIVWRRLRANHFSPNARNLLWQISHNILPIKTFLKERTVLDDDTCSVCNSQAESMQHRFFDCPINIPTWELIHKFLPFLKNLDLIQAMDLAFGLPPSLQRGAEILFSEGLYTLWTARNEVTFGRRQYDGPSVRELAARRIKVRLKAEYRLYGSQQFTDRWPPNWWWHFQGSEISFAF